MAHCVCRATKISAKILFSYRLHLFSFACALYFFSFNHHVSVYLHLSLPLRFQGLGWPLPRQQGHWTATYKRRRSCSFLSAPMLSSLPVCACVCVSVSVCSCMCATPNANPYRLFITDDFVQWTNKAGLSYWLLSDWYDTSRPNSLRWRTDWQSS